MGALPNLSFIAEAKAAATRLSVMITRKPEIICEIRKIILPGITFSSFLSIMNLSDQVRFIFAASIHYFRILCNFGDIWSG